MGQHFAGMAGGLGDVAASPLVTGGLLLAVGLWWQLSAKKWFTGPKHTVAELDEAADLA